MAKELYRDKQRASIGGVCAGLADYFSIDVTLVRALFLVALFGFGSGVLLYIILWIVIPEKKIDFNATGPTVDYTVNDSGEASPVDETKLKKMRRKNNESVIGGLVLLTLGVIFLADEFIPWFEFDKLWPLILVAVGAGIIWNNSKNKKDQ
jgi:phage shock protein PspC (stress-responsive transcriptional regulator)